MQRLAEVWNPIKNCHFILSSCHTFETYILLEKPSQDHWTSEIPSGNVRLLVFPSYRITKACLLHYQLEWCMLGALSCHISPIYEFFFLPNWAIAAVSFKSKLICIHPQHFCTNSLLPSFVFICLWDVTRRQAKYVANFLLCREINSQVTANVCFWLRCWATATVGAWTGSIKVTVINNICTTEQSGSETS